MMIDSACVRTCMGNRRPACSEHGVCLAPCSDACTFTHDAIVGMVHAWRPSRAYALVMRRALLCQRRGLTEERGRADGAATDNP